MSKYVSVLVSFGVLLGPVPARMNLDGLSRDSEVASNRIPETVFVGHFLEGYVESSHQPVAAVQYRGILDGFLAHHAL